MILHDLICKKCEAIEEGVLVEAGRYPRCDACGGQRTWKPSGLHTDLYGSPQYSDATGRFHSSQSEKDRVMRDAGYFSCGDKVHGARPEHSIKNTGFSYAGQPTRTSTQERAAHHKPVR